MKDEAINASEGSSRPRGRPRKVTTEEIVAAALAIGLDRATIRNVAERLGLTVPGLSYHVRTRDELLQMVSDRTLRVLHLQEDDRRSFPEVLLGYAEGLYELFSQQPVLIAHSVTGHAHMKHAGDYLSRLVERAVRDGYDAAIALENIRHVTTTVIGAAVLKARAEAVRQGEDVDINEPLMGGLSLGRDRDFFASVEIMLRAVLPYDG
jgi:AcrR family transcriptional regulator